MLARCINYDRPRLRGGQDTMKQASWMLIMVYSRRERSCPALRSSWTGKAGLKRNRLGGLMTRSMWVHHHVRCHYNTLAVRSILGLLEEKP